MKTRRPARAPAATRSVKRRNVHSRRSKARDFRYAPPAVARFHPEPPAPHVSPATPLRTRRERPRERSTPCLARSSPPPRSLARVVGLAADRRRAWRPAAPAAARRAPPPRPLARRRRCSRRRRRAAGAAAVAARSTSRSPPASPRRGCRWSSSTRTRASSKASSSSRSRAGQVVSGFALDVDGRMRDAVPVEKARAQQVFEDITRRRVDPGLLQTTQRQQLRAARLSAPAAARRARVELRIVGAGARRGCSAAARLRRRASPRFELDAPLRRRARARPSSTAAARSACASSAIARGGFSARAARARRRRCRGEPLRRPRLPRAASGAAITTEARDGQSLLHARAAGGRSAARRGRCRSSVQIVWDASGSARAARSSTASWRCSTPTSRRVARHRASTWCASPTSAAAPSASSVRGGDWTALRTRARGDGLRRRQQPRRGAPRRRLGRGALVQRRPGELRRAVAARLPGAGVRDQQRRERRPGGAAGARRRERRPQHRPRRDAPSRRRRRAAAPRHRGRRGRARSARSEIVVQSQQRGGGPARRRRRADRARAPS